MALISSSKRIGGMLLNMTPQLGSTRTMSDTNKVFVGGMLPYVKESVLRDAFSGFGDVTEVIIIKHQDTGESKGFGFVSFQHNESVEAAVDGLDGQIVNNRTLRVRPATPRY